MKRAKLNKSMFFAGLVLSICGVYMPDAWADDPVCNFTFMNNKGEDIVVGPADEVSVSYNGEKTTIVLRKKFDRIGTKDIDGRVHLHKIGDIDILPHIPEGTTKLESIRCDSFAISACNEDAGYTNVGYAAVLPTTPPITRAGNCIKQSSKAGVCDVKIRGIHHASVEEMSLFHNGEMYVWDSGFNEYYGVKPGDVSITIDGKPLAFPSMQEGVSDIYFLCTTFSDGGYFGYGCQDGYRGIPPIICDARYDYNEQVADGQVYYPGCEKIDATNDDSGINQEQPPLFYDLDSLLKQHFAKDSSSKWVGADGKFNTARLASDSIAGVLLGTAGGVVTSVVMKKVQTKQGFETMKCTIKGQDVAGYGDEFRVQVK